MAPIEATYGAPGVRFAVVLKSLLPQATATGDRLEANTFLSSNRISRYYTAPSLLCTRPDSRNRLRPVRIPVTPRLALVSSGVGRSTCLKTWLSGMSSTVCKRNFHSQIILSISPPYPIDQGCQRFFTWAKFQQRFRKLMFHPEQ